MAREPHFPDDATVGSGKSDDEKAGAPATEKESEAKRNKKLATGAAIGIGSAAIVAALLYANRRGRGERGGNG